MHLPFEQLRQQKDISLQFDADIEDLSQFPQHKDLKRSDPPFHSSIHPSPAPATVTDAASSSSPKPPNAPPAEDSAGYADDPIEYEYEDYSSEAASGEPASGGSSQQQQQQHPSLDSVKSNTNSEIVVSIKRSGEGQIGDGQQIGVGHQQQSQPSAHTSLGSNSSKSKANTSRFIINNEHHKSPTSSYSSSRGQSGHVYDNRPKPRTSSYHPQSQTPKVIVTTSTSIRDNNGRTINYSINSSSSSSNSSPVTTSSPRNGYDEYKEDDVLSDPFFLDVPKVGGGRRRRSAPTLQRKRRRRVIYIVP